MSIKFLLPVALAIALPLASCQSEPQASAEPVPAPTATATPTPEVDYYQQGLEKGKAAAVAAGTASDKEGWQGVVDGWDQAVATLRKVPADNPNYQQAQAKIKSYQAASGVAVDRRSKFEEIAVQPAVQETTTSQAPVETSTSTASDLGRLAETLAAVDPDGLLLSGIRLKSGDEDTAVFTMTMAFLGENDDVKLETAKHLWKIWASIHSPSQPDTSRVELVSETGTRIARSDIWGGSMVKLEK